MILYIFGVTFVTSVIGGFLMTAILSKVGGR